MAIGAVGLFENVILVMSASALEREAELNLIPEPKELLVFPPLKTIAPSEVLSPERKVLRAFSLLKKKLRRRRIQIIKVPYVARNEFE